MAWQANLLLSNAVLRPSTSTPLPPPTPAGLRLVSLNDRTWADTRAAGDILTALEHVPDGATVTAFLEGYLIGEKITCFGGLILAAADWADLPLGDHAITIAVTKDGVTKYSQTVVYKYSDGPADASCTTEEQFTAAIAACQVGSSGVYVIELDPGREWARRIRTDLPTTPVTYAVGTAIQLNLTGTRQVVIRSAGADRLNGPQAVMNTVDERVSATGRGVLWQNIKRIVRMTGEEWRTESAPRATTFYSGGATYEGVIRYLNCEFKSGVVSWDGINPDQNYDPADMRHVGDLTYFGAVFPASAGPVSQFRLYDPIACAWRSPYFTTAGVEHPVSPAVYIGDNLPYGVLPDNTGWPASGGVPITVTAGGGTGAAARFKPEYLASGDPRLPAGMNPGNYIVAVYIDSLGTGYTSADTDPRVSTRILTDPANPDSHRTLSKMGSLFSTRSNSAPWNHASPELHFARCRGGNAYRGVQVGCTSNKSRYVYECRFDGFYSDIMAWGASSNVTVRQDWNGPLMRFWFNIFGRGLSHSQDYANPHGDVLQLYAQGGTTDITYFVDWVMNLYHAGAGTRSAFQCLFFTDSNLVPVGALGDVFNARIFGHCQVGGLTNGVIAKYFQKWRAHRATMIGPRWTGGARPRSDLQGSHASDSEIATVNTNLYRSQQIARRNFTSLPNGTTGFVAPGTHAFMDSFEKLVASYAATPGGIMDGRGALGDQVQSLDWLGRSFDTDMIPAFFPFVPAANADFDTTVTSGPRQLFYGHQPKAVSVSGGARWRKAATMAELASAAWLSEPGELAPGEWIQIEGDAGNTPISRTRATVTIGGTESYLDVLTEDTAPALITNPGSYSVSTNAAATTENFQRLIMAAKVRVPDVIPTAQQVTMFGNVGSSNHPWRLYTNQAGVLRFRSGQTNDIFPQWIAPYPIQPGQDLLFLMAIDLTTTSPFEDENGVVIDDVAADTARAWVNYNDMLIEGGTIRAPKSSPTRMGTDTAVMGAVDGSTRMTGWGFHHFVAHWWNDEFPVPDLSVFETARLFSSAMLDSGDGSPGSGLVSLFGTKPKILLRGSAADANGAGLTNLGTYAPSRAPFVRAAGTDPYL